ncbi:hypothetical protein [Pseudomonas aegrilactucae]|uniref:Uncharacterized protein n=1 Tax=Pseudomonas aegrilactucae TaxID=2854028 RepID=A0A9Q3ADB6_9PSED|nr:hypothetical protein [Pseudomonas aegrilactucae]MBV6287299.1 hypothetical protein [Pseudomonas aegrilactucae]
MSLPELPKTTDRRELRKALIRLRLEMHRQEIRHESGQVLKPLTRLRSMGDSLQGGLQGGLGIKHGPLWGIGAVVLLGFLTGKGARSGSLTRLAGLGSSLAPLIRLFMQSGKR